MSQDDAYELVLLRALVKKINANYLDAALMCDEMKWEKLIESDQFQEAKRWLEVMCEIEPASII